MLAQMGDTASSISRLSFVIKSKQARVHGHRPVRKSNNPKNRDGNIPANRKLS
jgi:hypothetical protein